jgi:hypothetical protein
MARNPHELNAKQVAVLTWIRNGCPYGTYPQGYEHRIVARALEHRGLIKISGRGANWKAVITAEGAAWLDAPPVEVAPSESEADRLIAAVLEAGGTLQMPEGRESEQRYQRLVNASLASPNRPRGKKLETRPTGTWGRGPREIFFADHFDDLVNARPVPVPDHVGKYHPAVKAFLKDSNWQYVTKEHITRAARILQAVASEAKVRGIEVLDSATSSQRPSFPSRRGHLNLRIGDEVYSIEVREIAGKGGAKFDGMTWQQRQRLPSWIDRRGWTFISSGKLELILEGRMAPYGGQHFRDAKSLTVEDKLPEVFRTLEIYQLRIEAAEAQKQRAADERRQRWEVAIEQGKLAYFEHARWEHFKERSREWQALGQHRHFLAASLAALDGLTPEQRSTADDYLHDMERVVNEIDPLRTPATLVPTIADPTPDQLKPFIGAWNPYGPDR